MAIDSAESGSLLELPAGDYRGNIVIDKPLIIDGKDRGAKIIGDGSGTVIKIRSPFVTINLTILQWLSHHELRDTSGVLWMDSMPLSHRMIKHARRVFCPTTQTITVTRF